MKKLVMIVGLLVVTPVFAMELMNITSEENTAFKQHLLRALSFSQKMVEKTQVYAENPIYVMLSKMSDNLATHNGDIVKMISSDQDLAIRIKVHQQTDNNPLIQLGLQQIRNNVGDVAAAQEYVKKTRIYLADLVLKNVQPAYSNSWIGNIDMEGRLDHMKRNEQYPLDENAVKDYTATFIYQLLLAPKI